MLPVTFIVFEVESQQPRVAVTGDEREPTRRVDLQPVRVIASR